MASTRQPQLHDNLIGGVEMTLPAHLLKANQWRTCHNMRMGPQLVQVPKKKVNATHTGKGMIVWLGAIPSAQSGYGRVLFFTQAKLYLINGTALSGTLVSDSTYRRWATTLYNSSLYYTNELNPIRRTDGSTDAAVANAPSARYLCHWYDHLVAAYPTYQGGTFPNRLMISDLYGFSTWQPSITNEADHYDFVEWQSTDYPYTGITGIGKLGKVLWVYTPTAIVPLVYTGRPKVFQVADEGVVTGMGNTYPWTLACLNNVHFFFDGVEKNFFAFDGTAPQAIGEPVKQFMRDNLSTSVVLASKMWASVDTESSEVIWRFCSRTSTGDLDKLVRFNYRYKVWSTGSDENIHAFCGGIFRVLTAGELTGLAGALTGTAGMLGTDGTLQPRLFGGVSSSDGKVYQEETSADSDGSLLAADDPVLETMDFHYGQLGVKKECDAIMPNASWTNGVKLQVYAKGRDYLSTPIGWASTDIVGYWEPTMEEGELTFAAVNGNVLRYKFVGTGLRGLQFDAFSDGVYVKGAEQ